MILCRELPYDDFSTASEFKVVLYFTKNLNADVFTRSMIIKN